MFKKLFALCAATVLLAACEYRYPKSEGPMSGGTHTFSIYFETGSAKLPTTSTDTINKVVFSFHQAFNNKISLVGYTDTVGTPTSNDTLSMQRAEAVQKALMAEGVPAESITMSAKGEYGTPVKTPDNTAEQKNRVVEITVK
jgi:peptidoglycan-associated lipoprotein